MMRFNKLLSILIILLAVFSCARKDTYRLSGTLTGIEDGAKLYLMVYEGEDYVLLDSTTADATGSFVFSGVISQPNSYRLTTEASQNRNVTFFLAAGETRVEGDMNLLDQASVTGNDVQEEYNTYLSEFSSYDDQLQEMYDKYLPVYREATANNDTAMANAISIKFDSVYKAQEEFQLKFIQDRPSSFVTPYIIYRGFSYTANPNELKEKIQPLDPEVLESGYGKYLVDRIALLEKTGPGAMYTDFTLADTSGNDLSLSSLVGENYLLIDFWASWCGPCRRENPNVVRLYNKYHERGFEILGVSFDNSREDWVKGIMEDQIPWPQVSDLKGWDSYAGELYGIRSIPHTVLLDKDGTIMVHGLRGLALEDKLIELLGD